MITDKKVFSSVPKDIIAPPDLIEVQIDSYQWFCDGNLLTGDTNQYLAVSTDTVYVNYFPLFANVLSISGSKLTIGEHLISVLTTKNNCSEMTQQIPIGIYSIDFFDNNVYTVGNLIHPDTACLGDTLKLLIYLPVQYDILWLNNGEPIPNANNDTLVVISSGNYQVSYYPYNCSDLITYSNPLTYNFIDCNNETTSEPPVLVYPNPSDGYINIIINPVYVGTEYTIIDIFGSTIRKGIFYSETNLIEMNAVASGVYILKVEQQNNQFIKLIKK